jgi:hypothetical protein
MIICGITKMFGGFRDECNWDLGNRNPYYPFQLAVAYFDWGLDGQPEETAKEAFSRYLETLEE